MPAAQEKTARAPTPATTPAPQVLSDQHQKVLDRLASTEAIRQLAARYSHFVDSRDLDALVGLFVEDVKVSSTASGRAALRESFAESLSEVGVTILKVTTHTIDFPDPAANPDPAASPDPAADPDPVASPDRATGMVYAHGDVQIGARWLHQAIRYDDRYERRDGIWYFSGRKHQLFYSVDVGQNPLGYAPANWPQSNIGLGSLPYSQPSWQKFWQNNNTGATDPNTDPNHNPNTNPNPNPK